MSSPLSVENDKDVVYGKENSIIFAIARMNPPTPGHLSLIEILIEQALMRGIDHVYVCLSKTKDAKNPIFCDMKKTVLGDAERHSDEMTMINSLKKTMMGKTTDSVKSENIHKMKVHLRCVPEEKGATPFTVVKHIINEKIDVLTKNAKDKGDEEYECPSNGIKLFLVIGEDRQSMIKDIRKCFAAWKQISAAYGKISERVGMNDLIKTSECPELLDKLEIKKVGKDDWSATVIRNIVRHGKKSKFLEIYEQFLTADVAAKLYDDIAEGLLKKDVPLKNEPKKKEPKQNEPKQNEPKKNETKKRKAKNEDGTVAKKTARSRTVKSKTILESAVNGGKRVLRKSRRGRFENK